MRTRHPIRSPQPRWARRLRFAAFASCLIASSVGNFALSQTSFPNNGNVETTNNELNPNAIFWPRNDFVIPFNIDATGQLPSEIQLEISDDLGRSWKLYSRSDVRGRQFNFVANTDGEYLFRLKTIDANGRSFENPGEPLHVVVDTTKPIGQLIIDISPRGVMQAEFSLIDIAIDPNSIQLEYQTESDERWKPIAFTTAPGNALGELIGSGEWNLPSSSRQLVVRLTAKDRAGNSVEVTRLPALPRSAALNGNMQFASGRTKDTKLISSNNSETIGSGLAFPPNKARNADNTNAFPHIEVLGGPGAKNSTPTPEAERLAREEMLRQQQQLIEQQQKFIVQQQNATRLNIGTPSTNAPAAIGPSTIAPAPFDPSANANANAVQFPNSSVGGNSLGNSIASSIAKPERKSTIKSNGRVPLRELTDEEIEQATAPNAINVGARRPSQSLLVQSPEDESTNSTPAVPNKNPNNNFDTLPKLPPVARNVKPLYSNSKKFSLEYAIDNDPGAPVSTVELWGTTDSGETWQVWGEDPDRESPFDIEVETEGLFGFRMVIVGANGLASNRPRNGDNADAWIHVDTAKPKAKITSATYGRGNEAGSMIIEYQASDEFLPERAITLSYSESPEGPWNVFAAGVRNNGRYAWPSDSSLPPSVFLQLEVHDAAGNVGIHRLEQPVSIEGLAPRGRIQGFRPR